MSEEQKKALYDIMIPFKVRGITFDATSIMADSQLKGLEIGLLREPMN